MIKKFIILSLLFTNISMLKAQTAFSFENLPFISPGSSLGVAIIEAYPHLPEFRDMIAIYPVPRTNKMALVLRTGEIYVFDDDPEVREIVKILDLSDRVNPVGSSALYTIAFHPNFMLEGKEKNNALYVYYIDYVAEENAFFFQLSQFELDPTNLVAKKGFELPLLRQLTKRGHLGAELFFAKDGFLYLSIGDLILGETREIAKYIYADTQRIDRLFNSCVLRLDIDMDWSRSHPIPKTLQARQHFQKEPSMGKDHPLYHPNNFSGNYAIPNDNPFVGKKGALEEYFTLGNRNPYKLSYDEKSGAIVSGDVGSNMSNPIEEVNLIEKGKNYGWCVLEDRIEPEINTIYKIKPFEGMEMTPPIYSYAHDVGNSVTGGFIYRGKKIPKLQGKYIFGDWSSRAIWAMDIDKPGKADKIAIFKGTEIRSFGINHAKEMLVLDVNGSIKKFAPLPKTKAAPENLAMTGVFKTKANGNFDPNKELAIADNFIAYKPISEQWQDGAVAKRWLYLPKNADGTPKKITHFPDEPWDFPKGSVFIKHIEIEDGSKMRRLETQFLVHGQDSIYYGLSYKWNAKGTNASLVTKTNVTEELSLRQKDGSSQKITWEYNDPDTCLKCHSNMIPYVDFSFQARNAGYVLGVNSWQLNHQYNGKNQLLDFIERGYFENPPSTAEKNKIPKAAAIDDKNADAETRARTWLATNCAHCHRGKGSPGVRSHLNLLLNVPTGLSKAVDGFVHLPIGAEGDKLVFPGKPKKSILLQRVKSNIFGITMPPVFRSVEPKVASAIIKDWISGMKEEIHALPVFQKVVRGGRTSFKLDDLFSVLGEIDENSIEIIEKPKTGKIRIDKKHRRIHFQKTDDDYKSDYFTYLGKTKSGISSNIARVDINVWGARTRKYIFGAIIVAFAAPILLALLIFLSFKIFSRKK